MGSTLVPVLKSSAVSAEYHALRHWFLETALPLWWEKGTDNEGGGFFEKLDDAAHPIEEPRRARLVARQIYVYALAGEMGWTGPADIAVTHGLDFLQRRLLRADCSIVASVTTSGAIIRGEFDLYDAAFVLFGLSAAARAPARRKALVQLAGKIRDQIVGGFSHPLGGFEEARPPSLPLKANPHMHLLEAFLAWAELETTDSVVWNELADKIVELCLERLIDPRTGVICEFYDAKWRPLPDAFGLQIEPGHQFEWAWLLLRWAELRGNDCVVGPATRLIQIGESAGVDPIRGVAINALDGALRSRDDNSRLWPQTERVKAWYSLALRPKSDLKALEILEKSLRGLRLFTTGRLPGLWWETLHPDGNFDPEPARASTLYHIACAIHTLSEIS
jgi:mannose/cellobiose epimerase-like protein (N-acyl-D-glucosamine 2-epimerase family)